MFNPSIIACNDFFFFNDLEYKFICFEHIYGGLLII